MPPGFSVELDTYMVMDGRETLPGRVVPAQGAAGGPGTPVGRISRSDRSSCRGAGATPSLPAHVDLELAPVDGGPPLWGERLRPETTEFELPVGQFPGGYFALRVSSGADDDWRHAALLAIGRPRPITASADAPDPYLDFVGQTIDAMLKYQTARLDDADVQLFLTVSRPVSRSYRSLGHRKPDGTHQTYWFPETPLDHQPFLADLDLWPLLREFATLTGRADLGQLVDDMAATFVKHGFDARSGLGYLGEEAGFDVLNAGCASTKVNSPPHFKPRNSGALPGLPLDDLWRHGPEQMQRMFRAMYYGLVTDAESMDYNRFCEYGFSDADRRPAMVRNAGHCAFETAGARMIHWWGSCYGETGDADCLGWAEQMIDKWAAIQHPESGLVPNFFGAVGWQENAPMPPGDWAETRGVAMMASALVEGAREFSRRRGGEALAGKLQTMARRLAMGLAQHCYDADSGIFIEHLHLDGRRYERTARYCFRTSQERETAIRHDPQLAQVPVYTGAGFYRPRTYWEHSAGVGTPVHVAGVADALGDVELADLLRPWAADVAAASRREARPFTSEGAWTWRGSAHG
ncbi:MAG TPA: hypothetical protein QGH10_24785, partial [Armatimonadota bacterium]|nr:hypothetical protein [Armatimonadota bacterium]